VQPASSSCCCRWSRTAQALKPLNPRCRLGCSSNAHALCCASAAAHQAPGPPASACSPPPCLLFFPAAPERQSFQAIRSLPGRLPGWPPTHAALQHRLHTSPIEPTHPNPHPTTTHAHTYPAPVHPSPPPPAACLQPGPRPGLLHRGDLRGGAEGGQRGLHRRRRQVRPASSVGASYDPFNRRVLEGFPACCPCGACLLRALRHHQAPASAL
jgi:hypothetical protein